MKAIIVSLILVFGAMTLFTACERNDYQHPMHRNGSK